MGTRSRKAHLGATVSSLLFVVASLLAVPASAGAADLSISIDKTVYLGHDGGAGCSGVDSLEGASGAAITYCFAVTNTGSEALAGAAVSDPALGISSDDMTLRSGDPALLTPGAGALWFYETSITSDLINTATVGAFPLDPSGGPSYGDGPIIASDSASVTVSEAGGPSEPLPAGISIDKTVYAGHDAGASCPGANAVTVAAGTDLTFCFQVTNTGETYLANVTIDDAILGITQDQMTVSSGSLALMAPGAVTTLYYETTAGELAYTNTAITTGTPSDEEGNPIPETQPPTDEDDASVDIEDESVTPTAAIDIVKLVYEGHDSGAGCGTTADGDTVTAADGTPITYCFVVTNTGEAYLANVTVDDPTLGITDADMTLLSGDPALLAPGATVVWYYETTLDGDLDNVASTTGTPADEAGTPIPDVQPPTDQDDASVRETDEPVVVLPDDLETDIQIEKTVYEGHTDGAGCATAGEDVFAEYGTLITYCFAVTNTGTVHLANVTVDDPTLGITDSDMTLLSGDPALLAPGDTVVWYYETTLDDDIRNVATTTGTPSNPDGTPIPATPPTDSDDALVGEQAVLQEELPSTGIDADVIAWLGVAMLAAGAVLISTDRLRRGRTASIASSRNVTPGLWTLYSTAPSRERATARRRRLRR